MPLDCAQQRAGVVVLHDRGAPGRVEARDRRQTLGNELTMAAVTAENMIQHIYGVMDQALSGYKVTLQSVVLYETPTSWATLTRPA